MFFYFCFEIFKILKILDSPTKDPVHLELFRPLPLYVLELYNGQNPSIVGDQETSLQRGAFVTILNLKDT